MKRGCCQCGAVEYEYTGTPLTCVVCHCTDCQKASGSAFSISMVVQRSDVAVVAGEIVEDEFLLNGNEVLRARCTKCGTGLWYSGKAMPAVLALKPGTLTDTRWLKPVAHAWTRSAQPWLKLDPAMKQYETQPPIEELIDLWQQQNA